MAESGTGAGGGVEAVREAWSTGEVSRRITARLDLPGAGERSDALPARLGEATRTALGARGIERLWSHQREAVDHVLGGRHVVVATPTASGKSLCYQIPMIQALAENPRATALLVFPTKALEHDQGKSLASLLEAAGVDAPIAAYDGDASRDRRQFARSRARVVLTNPDMLHLGMLPHHTSWSGFLSGLAIIVVDELHQYRGVFGNHFANVIRRLHRVLEFHGARPVWVASSATILNPAELAEALVGRPFELVERSGAPRGPRALYFMSPPLVDASSGVRGSYLHLASRLAADLVEAGLQTLVFAQSRRAVEIVLRYVRDRIRKIGMEPELAQGYRGGYLPELRRRIEDGLKREGLTCVVATNALELGVDVGSLDAVVLAGYPGSISSTWQRIGRAGRTLAPSIAVIVGSAAPLDQFVVQHPEYLADASPERGLVNPDNLEILLDHMRCASFELPFEAGETFGGLEADEVGEIMAHFAARGFVHSAKGRHVWVADEYPGASVGLRSIGEDAYTVVDRTTGQVIGEVDGRSATRMIHEGAIYQHAGMPYLVEELDTDRRRATVVQVEPEHYTQATAATTIRVIEHIDRAARGWIDAALGEVGIVEKVTGYKRIRYGTHENLGYVELDLPDRRMEAFAAWIELTGEGLAEAAARLATRPGVEPAVLDLPEQARPGSPAVFPGAPGWIAEGLVGLGGLVQHIAALRLMCDVHDLVPVPGTSDSQDPSIPARPALYLHEAHPGGVGLVEKLHADLALVAADALSALAGCPCEFGCPSCVGPPDRDDAARKQAAGVLLEMIVESSADG